MPQQLMRGACSSRRAVLLLSVVALGACDQEPTGPTVTTVTVTSPIGDVMAVQRSLDLSASASDASGDAVSARGFEWTSSAPSVASVSGDGVVQGVAEGTATITATTDGVSGSLTLRVVAADLTTISVLLDDAYTGSLVSSLGAGVGDEVSDALTDCRTALDAGNVLALDDCLQAVPNASSSDGTDRALLAVLEVIAVRARLLLNL